MGLNLFGSSCSCEIHDNLDKLPNPDPKNYEVLDYVEYSKYLLLKVRYPDCTNYEGVKILVFEGLKYKDIVNKNCLDPHFCESSKLVARFAPTKEGFSRANRFCATIS